VGDLPAAQSAVHRVQLVAKTRFPVLRMIVGILARHVRYAVDAVAPVLPSAIGIC
jgi:hypothetical protein